MGSPDGINKLYLGLYVDDLIYFRTSRGTEIAFERKLQSLVAVDFMGEVNNFLGIKFSWIREFDDHVSVRFTQEAFVDHLIDIADLSTTCPVLTPYMAGHPVDTVQIPMSHLPRNTHVNPCQRPPNLISPPSPSLSATPITLP